MPTCQLILLFLCSLIPWMTGSGMMPLLPVFAARLGASSAASGAFLAVAYFAITLGGAFGGVGLAAAVLAPQTAVGDQPAASAARRETNKRYCICH